MSAEREALRDALAPYLYEAYRLGKYGAQEYLPMWHEKPAAEHSVIVQPWHNCPGVVVHEGGARCGHCGHVVCTCDAELAEARNDEWWSE